MSELVLAKRTAVITGASAGIGRAITEQLVSLGWRVVVNARRADRLSEFARELNGKGSAAVAEAVPGDCADEAVIERVLDAAARRFGAPADAVIVNAGRGLSGGVLGSDTAQWEDMIRTNVLAAGRLMRAASQRMMAEVSADSDPNAWQRKARDIVIIGSVVGRHVSPFSGMYGSTKFAVHGMAEALRREVAPRGIRVSLIEPGFVVSEFQGVAGYQPDWFKGVVDRIGPVLQPQDVARAVAFVLSQPAHVHVSDIVVRPSRQDYP